MWSSHYDMIRFVSMASFCLTAAPKRHTGQSEGRYQAHVQSQSLSLVLTYVVLTSKLEQFAILFSQDIVVSVKKSKQISLLNQWCRKKIRQQSAWPSHLLFYLLFPWECVISFLLNQKYLILLTHTVFTLWTLLNDKATTLLCMIGCRISQT